MEEKIKEMKNIVEKNQQKEESLLFNNEELIKKLKAIDNENGFICERCKIKCNLKYKIVDNYNICEWCYNEEIQNEINYTLENNIEELKGE